VDGTEIHSLEQLAVLLICEMTQLPSLHGGGLGLLRVMLKLHFSNHVRGECPVRHLIAQPKWLYLRYDASNWGAGTGDGESLMLVSVKI
jgi:hypothetical protein